MFIAKKDNLIILARNTREELEKALRLITYDSIEETNDEYVLVGGEYLSLEDANAKERERLNLLSLTAADVERAIYKAKGMDFEDVIEMVSQLMDTSPQPSPQGEGGSAAIDVKALKIELKANNFYRGNPYIEQVGSILGFTSQMLDEFFETGDYKKLVASEENND